MGLEMLAVVRPVNALRALSSFGSVYVRPALVASRPQSLSQSQSMTKSMSMSSSASSASLSAQSVADSLWKSVYCGDAARAAALHVEFMRRREGEGERETDRERDRDTKEVQLAAMAAYGTLGRTDDVLRGLRSLSLAAPQRPLQLDERLLYVLLHGLCVARELKSAEALLFLWIDRVTRLRPRLTHTKPHTHSQTQTEEVAPPPPPPPLVVLRGLLKEWRALPAVPDYVIPELRDSVRDELLIDFDALDWSRVGHAPIPLHVFTTFLRAYAADNQWRRCWLLLDIIEKEKPPSTTGPSADEVQLDVLISRHHFLESMSDATLWSILFHHSLHAVCSHQDQDLAENLLARMKRAGVKVELIATMYLLKTYHTGTLTLDSNTTTEDHRIKQEHAIAIYPKMFNAILSLMKRNLATGDGYHAAKTMTKEYLHVLCKLGRVDLADTFLTELGRHELTRRFTQFPQLVQPLVHSYSKQAGKSLRCLQLFEDVAHRHHEQPMMFHSVCEALHAARDFDKLGDFVEKYGKLSLSDKSKLRRQTFSDALSDEQKHSRILDDELIKFVRNGGEKR